MPALYAGKRVGKPLMRSHTYNAMFNGKLVWPLDKDTVVSIRITDDKGRTLPKSLAVNGTLKLGAKATYADGHVGDLLTTNDVTFASRDTSTATVSGNTLTWRHGGTILVTATVNGFTSTATVSGNTLTWRHGGTILVTATVNGFTSAAVSISAAYAPESIQGPLALFGDSQLIVDSDTSLTNMGPYPSGANPGTATSWPSDQVKQIASITGLRVIDLYYGGARIARDKTGWQGGWAMQSNRLASLVKADAANTPGVIVIYGFYSNDLHDGLTDTKPATDLSKIAAAYKAKFDELKAKYPQARILYALQCMFRSAATEAKPVMTGLPAGTIMTNNFTALQSSERILFTETTLGVPVIDATDEVWALGSGLTVSDMIHPTAEGAVKLGQILGRHIKQAIQQ